MPIDIGWRGLAVVHEFDTSLTLIHQSNKLIIQEKSMNIYTRMLRVIVEKVLLKYSKMQFPYFAAFI